MQNKIVLVLIVVLLIAGSTFAQKDRKLWQPYRISPCANAQHIELSGIKRAFYATDNNLWLAPGENKEITIEVLWREPVMNKNIFLSADAWNTKK